METSTDLFSAPGEVLALPVRKFTVEEYHRMLDLGVLLDGDRCELLEGWIVRKMGKKPAHVWSLEAVAKALGARLPSGWHVRRQDPRTTEESEPEPDIAGVRGTEEEYRTRHPLASETALAIEISDTTLNADRTVKQRIYARAGIPVYWIVNLVDSQIEVSTDPTGPRGKPPRYRQQQNYRIGDTVPLLIA